MMKMIPQPCGQGNRVRPIHRAESDSSGFCVLLTGQGFRPSGPPAGRWDLKRDASRLGRDPKCDTSHLGARTLFRFGATSMRACCARLRPRRARPLNTPEAIKRQTPPARPLGPCFHSKVRRVTGSSQLPPRIGVRGDNAVSCQGAAVNPGSTRVYPHRSVSKKSLHCRDFTLRRIRIIVRFVNNY
jgi:hypothetical protein